MREKPDRKSANKLKNNNKKVAENTYDRVQHGAAKDANGGVQKSRESIIADLEWDDNGIQLDTDVFMDELWLHQGQAFQNSILR